MRTIERDSLEHWKIWRSTVSFDDDDDERIRSTKKKCNRRATRQQQVPRTFAARFPRTTREDRTGNYTEPVSTFKSCKYNSKYRNASCISIGTSSRHIKTSHGIVGPTTYDPVLTGRSNNYCYSFPQSSRFTSSEISSTTPNSTHYSIDATRPCAPSHRFPLASRHFGKRRRDDNTTTSLTYSSFRGGPSHRFGPTSPYSDSKRKTSFFIECSPVFGYGCSVEEHIRYGQCLDGKCGKRAPWEGNVRISLSLSLSLSKRIYTTSHTCIYNDNNNNKQIPGRVVVPPPIDRKPNPLLPGLLFAAKRGDMDAAVKWLSSSTRLILLQQDDRGRNVLHVCASRDQVSMAKMLLSRAFELKVHKELSNAKNLQGRTPLHVAADLYNEPMVKLLLRFGASSDILDENGQTAKDILMSKSHAKAHHCFRAVMQSKEKNVERAGW